MREDFGRRVADAVASIRKRSQDRPRVGVILGSGLSAVAESIEGRAIPFSEISGMPAPTVSGHVGVLKLGRDVATLAGRRHLYEGCDPDEVVLPTAVLRALGCETVILTNAAGGVNRDYSAGDIVLIRDHINFMGRNPLVGPNVEGMGPRFPDMGDVYTSSLRALVRHAVARKIPGLQLREGVYMAFSGPSYESPAEIAMARMLGADLVGMSTVPEAIVARWSGMRIVGLSCVTNMAAGILDKPLDHAEVVEAGNRVRDRMSSIVLAAIDAILANSV